MEIVETEMCDVRSTSGSEMSSDACCSQSGSVTFDDGTEVPREVANLGVHADINMFELTTEGQLQALAQAHARIAAEKRLQQEWFLTPVLGKSLSWVRHHPHEPCPTRTAPTFARRRLVSAYSLPPEGINVRCVVAGAPHIE